MAHVGLVGVTRAIIVVNNITAKTLIAASISLVATVVTGRATLRRLREGHGC